MQLNAITDRLNVSAFHSHLQRRSSHNVRPKNHHLNMETMNYRISPQKPSKMKSFDNNYKSGKCLEMKSQKRYDKQVKQKKEIKKKFRQDEYCIKKIENLKSRIEKLQKKKKQSKEQNQRLKCEYKKARIQLEKEKIQKKKVQTKWEKDYKQILLQLKKKCQRQKQYQQEMNFSTSYLRQRHLAQINQAQQILRAADRQKQQSVRKVQDLQKKLQKTKTLLDQQRQEYWRNVALINDLQKQIKNLKKKQIQKNQQLEKQKKQKQNEPSKKQERRISQLHDLSVQSYKNSNRSDKSASLCRKANRIKSESIIQERQRSVPKHSHFYRRIGQFFQSRDVLFEEESIFNEIQEVMSNIQEDLIDQLCEIVLYIAIEDNNMQEQPFPSPIIRADHFSRGFNQLGMRKIQKGKQVQRGKDQL